MTREKAQELLREAADLLDGIPAEATVTLESGTLLRELRDGLFPCACQGRELLARFRTDIILGVLDVNVPEGCPDGRVRVLILSGGEE